jgi:hypothetical protein
MASPTKPKIYVIGSSHAFKIFQSLQKIPNLEISFELRNYTKPGSTVQKLHKPNSSEFTEQDIIIVQTSGNDLFEKRYVKVENFGKGRKIFHLEKFAPTSLTHRKNAILFLKEFLRETRSVAKVLVIDNPIRHGFCCIKHQHKDTSFDQEIFNKRLKAELSELSHVQVINHRKLLPYRHNKLKNYSFYNTLLKDSVHFKAYLYDNMARKIMQMIQGP